MAQSYDARVTASPIDATANGTLDEAIIRTADTTSDERRSLGEAHRRDVPLESHAEVPPLDQRADPIAVLTGQDTSRLADLVPIRHGRMSASAFTFYRGAAAVMAADLSRLPTTAIRTQLCGDAHLSNFGVFNGPDRRLVFDLNDFDETLPGPFEWDLKRLAASIAVAARNNEVSDAKAQQAAWAAVSGYRRVMNEVAQLDPLSVRYYRIEFEDIVAQLDRKHRERSESAAAKARKRNSLRAFDRLTEFVDGTRRIVDDPPLLMRLETHHQPGADAVEDLFAGYLESLPLAWRRVLERYRITDVAHKVVGVGSVGTRSLIVLLTTGDDQPLFLQFKEATSSVLEPYLGASEFSVSGERVVQGQRLMQSASDVFLGWAQFDSSIAGRTVDFYFRQLWDGKGSADVDSMGGKRLRIYAELCGATLALAHGRTGDAAMIAGYMGDDETFDRAIGEFAMSYADLNERDHEAHLVAIDAGHIPANRDI